jgi:hypothetical protein
MIHPPMHNQATELFRRLKLLHESHALFDLLKAPDSDYLLNQQE